MASTQTMTHTSIFSNPFHDPSNNPEALGSYTGCQGPPAKHHTSAVAKFRKQIASALSTRPSNQNLDIVEFEPFDTEIVILDFVPEDNSKPATGIFAPAEAGKTSPPPVASDTLERLGPFDIDIVIMDYVESDERKQPDPSREIRRISSRATIAGPSRSPY